MVSKFGKHGAKQYMWQTHKVWVQIMAYGNSIGVLYPISPIRWEGYNAARV